MGETQHDPGVATPKRKAAVLTAGGAVAGAACTTKVADALMDEVLPVMLMLPVDAAGMVMPVLNAPVDVVWNENVAEPTITVPVVDALNPVPATVARKHWLDDRAKNRNLIKKPAINSPTTDAAREQT
jgi:hypothetical protein